MFPQYSFFKALVILTSIFGIMSCTPAFETTAEKCVTFLPARLAVNDYVVQANSTTNDYKLYLEDALNNLSDLQSTSNGNTQTPQALNANEQAVIEYIINKAIEKLNYTIENGLVVSADNELDLIESLMVATDPGEVIETFVQAKRNLAEAITKNDSVCNYRNSAIEVQKETFDSGNSGSTSISDFFKVQLDISFNPFADDTIIENADELVDFNIGISSGKDLLIDIADRQLEFFNSFNRMDKKDFTASGVSPSIAKRIDINKIGSSELFEFTDDFIEFNTSEFGIRKPNNFCFEDDNRTKTSCPEGVLTRTPELEACKGGDNSIANETGQVQKNWLDIVPNDPELSDLQRVKLEIDYRNDEIRFYVSKFHSAFLRPGENITIDNYNPSTDVIFNPTSCEDTAAREELRILQGKETTTGISVTRIEDPGFDFIDIKNESGEVIGVQDPTPLYTFKRTVTIARK
jgi:hypothetical protein